MDLYACGSNSEGQLGIGHTDDSRTWTPCTYGTQAFPPRGWTVVEIASSASATLALCQRDNESQLWTCGHAWPTRDTSTFAWVDARQELGIQGPVVHVAAVWDCMYVIERVSEGDRLWALGLSNAFGQWGTSEAMASTRNAEMPPWCHRVDVDACLPRAAAGPWRVHTIAGGVRHVLAVLTSTEAHYLVGWGHARHGQLGPIHARVVQTPKKLLSLWTAEPLGQPPPTYALALGMAHSVVAAQHDNETRIWLWGSNRHGQLEIPGGAWEHEGAARFATLPHAVVPACMWRTTLLHVDGRVRAHGAESHAQTSAHDWLCHGTLRAGSEHALLLDTQGTVYGWGWNEHGNLAHAEESVAPRVVWDGPAASCVWTGYGTSWVGVPAAS